MMVNMRIETLRGLACILLVLYHVIGADSSHGLLVEDGPIRWFNDGLAYLRMPLFTFLSGLVYGMRPFSGNSRAFLVGKVRRLLIPMLVVGTLFAVLQAVTPGTNSVVGPWYLLHLKPVGHFWFVESLFWVFLLIWVLERWHLMRQPNGFMLVLALACALYLLVRGWPWLGIDGAIYLLPYFLVGLAFSRFSLTVYLTNGWLRFGLLALAIICVIFMGMPVANPDRRTVVMLLAGVSLCLLCLSLGMTVPWLSSIGRHSYAIYLFHVFFTASARIGIHRLHIDYMLVDIIFGLALGLTGPIVIDRLASRSKWPALLLLGKTVKTSTAHAH
jgi:surface polysaccharide O-acyltransferase-like enzyme